MANQAYAKFLQKLGEAGIDLTSGEFRVALTDTDIYTPNLTDGGHEFVNQITDGGILSEATLLSVTWSARVFDADDFPNTFPDHGGGATGEALLIYKHVAANYNVIVVDAGNNKITVAGDQRVDFRKGKLTVVTGATDLNGEYNVKGVVFDSTNTVIEMYEDVTGTTADGDIEASDAVASPLCFWADQVTGLPIILDGNDDSLTWNGQGIWRNNV